MPEIVFIEHNGTEHRVQGEVGKTIMQIALDNMVPGVLGDCGGNCSCATCHGYIDPAWRDKVPPAGDDETLMIDCALDVGDGSRLTCQVQMADALNGIVVRWPKTQL